ncbi:abc1 family protein group 11 [hydrocarbon metagenome]|uniref:Abc1 family protein group 11 n=1 Tax=hydrocarbon metagenome TaxID=938273 RepID=A0A0W8FDV0_9ZZZZ
MEDRADLRQKKRLLDEELDGIEPLLDRTLIDERPCHERPHETAAHRCLGPVEQAEQGGGVVVPADASGDLQVSERHGVQDHLLREHPGREAADVGERRLLRLFCVPERGARRGDGARHPLAPVALERGDGKMLAEEAACGVREEGVVCKPAHHDPLLPEALDQAVGDIGRHDALGGPVLRHLGDALVEVAPGAAGRGEELPGRDVQKRDPKAPPAVGCDRHQVSGAGGSQHAGIDHRAGRDHPDDVALHHALGNLWILHLIADHHLVAPVHEPCDIGFGRMERHACKRHALPVPVAPPRRQDDIELPRNSPGILPERLVEVAHLEEEDGVGMPGFERIVLFHCGGGSCRHRCTPKEVTFGSYKMHACTAVLKRGQIPPRSREERSETRYVWRSHAYTIAHAKNDR